MPYDDLVCPGELECDKRARTMYLKLKTGWESHRAIKVASRVASIEKAMSSIRTIEDLA